MNNEYTVLPMFYDALNSDVDYDDYVFYLTSFIDVKNSKILDLGCGTGDVSVRLSKLGASVIGLDNSPEMLTLASHKSDKARAEVFFTCQDMTSFSTGNTFDAVVSTFDSLNYVKSKAGLERAFDCVARELKKDGLFLFDMNSEYKFENIYADNSYVLEADDVFCAWQNFYDSAKKLCDFYINVFAKAGDTYKRYYEVQTERMFTLKEIKIALKKSGFLLLDLFSDTKKSAINDTTERYYFVAKKI